MTARSIQVSRPPAAIGHSISRAHNVIREENLLAVNACYTGRALQRSICDHAEQHEKHGAKGIAVDL